MISKLSYNEIKPTKCHTIIPILHFNLQFVEREAKLTPLYTNIRPLTVLPLYRNFTNKLRASINVREYRRGNQKGIMKRN